MQEFSASAWQEGNSRKVVVALASAHAITTPPSDCRTIFLMHLLPSLCRAAQCAPGAHWAAAARRWQQPLFNHKPPPQVVKHSSHAAVVFLPCCAVCSWGQLQARAGHDRQGADSPQSSGGGSSSSSSSSSKRKGASRQAAAAAASAGAATTSAAAAAA
jgi:hypothetical protein